MISREPASFTNQLRADRHMWLHRATKVGGKRTHQPRTDLISVGFSRHKTASAKAVTHGCDQISLRDKLIKPTSTSTPSLPGHDRRCCIMKNGMQPRESTRTVTIGDLVPQFLRLSLLTTLVLVAGLTASVRSGPTLLRTKDSYGFEKPNPPSFMLVKKPVTWSTFCFTNKSRVGRALLSKCTNKGECKFKATVDWSRSCGDERKFLGRPKNNRIETGDPEKQEIIEVIVSDD